MTQKKNPHLKIVQPPEDLEEIKKRTGRFRREKARRILATAVLIILAVCGTYLLLKNQSYGQARLADKGAALKDLPADAQQGLAAGGTGQARHRLVGTGVYGTEFPHGAGLPPGGAGQSQLPQFRAAVHPAGHGRA